MRAARSRDPLTEPMRWFKYRWPSRVADWLHGRRDGRRGLPAAEPLTTVFTPAAEALIRAAGDSFAGEWMLLESVLTEPLRRRADAQVRRRFAERALAEADRELAECPPVPSEEELLIRREGERHASAGLVRTHRLAEHRRRREPLRLAARQARDRLAQIDTEIAGIDELARRQIAIRQARVRSIHEHTLHRLASYHRSLVRSHPQGALILAALADARPTIPEWATAPPSQVLDQTNP